MTYRETENDKQNLKWERKGGGRAVRERERLKEEGEGVED